MVSQKYLEGKAKRNGTFKLTPCPYCAHHNTLFQILYLISFVHYVILLTTNQDLAAKALNIALVAAFFFSTTKTCKQVNNKASDKLKQNLLIS